jgi:hypothetical protein
MINYSKILCLYVINLCPYLISVESVLMGKFAHHQKTTEK